jgi:hypothetical protein
MKTMYADTINGNFDMTFEDVMALMRENCICTDPDAIVIESTEGHTYTSRELYDLAGVDFEVVE